MHYIRVPADEGLLLFISEKRVICIINSVLEFHSALISKKEQGHIIYLGVEKLNKLKLKMGDKIVFQLKKDTLQYQFNFPEELEGGLLTD